VFPLDNSEQIAKISTTTRGEQIRFGSVFI
jgi:hypothetical protein